MNRQQRLERLATRAAARLDRRESSHDPGDPRTWLPYREALTLFERLAHELADIERHGVSFSPAARVEARTVQARRAGTRL